MAVLQEFEEIRKAVIGSYPGSYQENMERLEAQTKSKLMRGGLNILDLAPRIPCILLIH